MSRTESGSTTVGVADTTPATPRDGAAGTGAIASGRLGRYVLRERLGAGGMGEVYAAYDPELDRKVAVKLLHRVVGDLGADRLRREARTMARLSHRNLVAVHDVGEHEGQLFLAMELVDGGTLRGWAKDKPWQDVLRVYLDAGRGLAAAHDAGVIHRDFKPDNVLIGSDGRVAVGDFGIARRREHGGDAITVDGGGGVEASLTHTGAVIGTPRYMAPEQLDGLPADARSDQFAFAVALWEALFGTHPLAPVAGTVEELQAAMRGGDRLEIPSGPVPARVGRALQRALHPSPAVRWPTLPALLEELERALPRRRPWLLASAAVVVVAAAASAVIVTQSRSSSSGVADVCGGGEVAFDAVWSPARQTALRDAMLATGFSYAPGVHAAVVDGVSSWRSTWLAARQRACRASAVHREETPEVGAQRMSCFARQLDKLSATLGQLQRPDPLALRNARGAIGSLEDPARCERDDASMLDEPVLAAPAAALADGAARVTSEAEAANLLGRYPTAAPLAEVARSLASAAGSTRREARASWIGGLAASKLLGASKAVPLQERTRRLADAAGDDELRTRALIELAVYRLNSSEYPASLAFLEEAEAVLTRLGSRRDLRARVAGVRGLVEVELGQLDQAMAHGAEAVRLLEEREQPEDNLLAMEIARSAGAYQRARDYKRAIELLERAIGILERVHLGDHPTVADLLSTMGGLLIQSERREEAIVVLERSIRIRTTFFGENHPTLAGALQNLAAAHRQLGRIDEAEVIATRALALMRQRPELDYMISAALSSLGSIKVMRQRYAEAVPLYEEALERLAKEGNAESVNAADLRFKLGRALWRGNLDRARARREATAARSIYARLDDMKEHAAEIDAWLKSPDTAATPHFP